MKNIMIDLETLDTAQSAVFFSCGACYFDPQTGDIGKQFTAYIDIQSSINAGRTISASTLKWWMIQEKEAQQTFQKDGQSLSSFLSDFSTFCGDSSTVWGNGANFDISILENAYKGNAPWKFWNVRDVRTVADLAYPDVKKENFKFDGVPHVALDDAKYQVKYLSAMIRHLKNKI